MAKEQKKPRPAKMKKVGGIREAKKQQDRRLKRQGIQGQTHSVPGKQKGSSTKFRKLVKLQRINRAAKKLELAKKNREVAAA